MISDSSTNRRAIELLPKLGVIAITARALKALSLVNKLIAPATHRFDIGDVELFT